jgi:hypothetical protein
MAAFSATGFDYPYGSHEAREHAREILAWLSDSRYNHRNPAWLS